jgi:hypothetical protein
MIGDRKKDMLEPFTNPRHNEMQFNSLALAFSTFLIYVSDEFFYQDVVFEDLN